MPATVSQGSVTGSALNTETNFAAAITAAGTYVLRADLNNMAGGDQIELRVYVKVNNVERMVWKVAFANLTSDEPIRESLPMVVGSTNGSVRFAFIQTAGTLRALGYDILSL